MCFMLVTLNELEVEAFAPDDDALADALVPLGVPVMEISCPTWAVMSLVLPVSCQVLPD